MSKITIELDNGAYAELIFDAGSIQMSEKAEPRASLVDLAKELRKAADYLDSRGTSPVEPFRPFFDRVREFFDDLKND